MTDIGINLGENFDPDNIFPDVDQDQLTNYLDQRFGVDQTGGSGGSSTSDNDDNTIGGEGETPPADVDDTDDTDDPTADNDDDTVDDDTTITSGDSNDTTGEGNETHGLATYEVELDDGGKASFTTEELKAFHAFQRRLQNDRDFLTYLQSYNPSQSPTAGTGGVADSAPATSSPPVDSNNTNTVPDDLDLDDPNIKYLFEQNKLLKEELNTVKQVSTQTYTSIQEQQRQAVEGLVNTARDNFASKHKLSSDEAAKILDAAGRTGAAQTYMNGIDPLTGLPVEPNPISAISRAMEMVMWAMPEYRTKAIQDEVKVARQDRIKRSKLSALSGNSGSVSRTIPTPNNPQERRAAMITEVAAAMDMGS